MVTHADHADRLRLAHDVAQALLERYGAHDLLAIGVHGSVPRGADDADIEALAALCTDAGVPRTADTACDLVR